MRVCPHRCCPLAINIKKHHQKVVRIKCITIEQAAHFGYAGSPSVAEQVHLPYSLSPPRPDRDQKVPLRCFQNGWNHVEPCGTLSIAELCIAQAHTHMTTHVGNNPKVLVMNLDCDDRQTHFSTPLRKFSCRLLKRRMFTREGYARVQV